MKTTQFLHTLLLSTPCAFLLALGRPAGAHPMPHSLVMLDFHKKSIAAELRLPLGELEFATGESLTLHPADSVARHRQELTGYVAQHVSASAPDGRRWAVQVSPVYWDAGRQAANTPPVAFYPGELVANVNLTPPPGAPLRKFTLHYDVIVHQLLTHVTQIYVRKDWNGGIVFGDPVFLAEVRWYSKTLHVDLHTGSVWKGYEATALLDARHANGPAAWLAIALAALSIWALRNRRRPALRQALRPSVGQLPVGG